MIIFSCGFFYFQKKTDEELYHKILLLMDLVLCLSSLLEYQSQLRMVWLRQVLVQMINEKVINQVFLRSLSTLSTSLHSNPEISLKNAWIDVQILNSSSLQLQLRMAYIRWYDFVFRIQEIDTRHLSDSFFVMSVCWSYCSALLVCCSMSESYWLFLSSGWLLSLYSLTE